MNVIQQSMEKLEPCIKQFLLSLMSGDSKTMNSQVQYHEVIFDLYCCAPQTLSGVLPYVTEELMVNTDLLVFLMLYTVSKVSFVSIKLTLVLIKIFFIMSILCYHVLQSLHFKCPILGVRGGLLRSHINYRYNQSRA